MRYLRKQFEISREEAYKRVSRAKYVRRVVLKLEEQERVAKKLKFTSNYFLAKKALQTIEREPVQLRVTVDDTLIWIDGYGLVGQKYCIVDNTNDEYEMLGSYIFVFNVETGINYGTFSTLQHAEIFAWLAHKGSSEPKAQLIWSWVLKRKWLMQLAIDVKELES